MLFLYVRHGNPIYDPDSLTEEGHAQAEALSKRLSKYGVDEIYASTSNRARLTAKPTCEKLGLEATLLDWANEGHAFRDTSVQKEDGNRQWCFYSLKYRSAFTRPDVRALGEKWYEHELFKEDNFAAGVQRVDREVDEFFRSLGYEHERETGRFKAIQPNEKRVALFAHQGFGMLFLSSVLGIPYNEFCVRFDISCSSMTAIRFGVSADGYVYPKLMQLSNDGHLYKEGLSTLYNCDLEL